MIRIRHYQQVLDYLKRKGRTNTRQYKSIQQRLEHLKKSNLKQKVISKPPSKGRKVTKQLGKGRKVNKLQGKGRKVNREHRRNMIRIRHYQGVLDYLKRKGRTNTRQYKIIQQRLEQLKKSNRKQKVISRRQGKGRNVNRNNSRRNLIQIRHNQRVLDHLKQRGRTNTKQYKHIQQRLQRLKGSTVQQRVVTKQQKRGRNGTKQQSRRNHVTRQQGRRRHVTSSQRQRGKVLIFVVAFCGI